MHKRLGAPAWWAIFMWLLHLGAQPTAAQARGTDALWVAGASLVFVTPALLGLRPATPAPCGPCDREAVPAFDRWALRPHSQEWSATSWFTGFAAVAIPLLDLWDEGDAGRAAAAAVVISTSWAVGATEVLKAAARRARPALYQAVVGDDARHEADNRRSFPSGHASGAMAAAASYFWSRRALDGTTGEAALMPLGLAVTTGIMRVAAGKHFPSDVLGGFAVGILTALIVREARL